MNDQQESGEVNTAERPARPWAGLWELFLTFFRIGAFTIGGGYVMVPLIQKDLVDKRQWLSKEEFVDILAVAQTAPGPIAVNTSVYAGYTLRGLRGAIASVGGCILPSIMVILVVAAAFDRISAYHLMKAAFAGIRPAVAVLIVSAVLKIGKPVVRSWQQLAVAVGAACAVAVFHISPPLVITIAALVGLALGTGGALS
ncbi:MAG: chromate transporter [Clostridia bacterium]|nr:chromate transporter [Clostridia bacterium]